MSQRPPMSINYSTCFLKRCIKSFGPHIQIIKRIYFITKSLSVKSTQKRVVTAIFIEGEEPPHAEFWMNILYPGWFFRIESCQCGKMGTDTDYREYFVPIVISQVCGLGSETNRYQWPKLSRSTRKNITVRIPFEDVTVYSISEW